MRRMRRDVLWMEGADMVESSSPISPEHPQALASPPALTPHHSSTQGQGGGPLAGRFCLRSPSNRSWKSSFLEKRGFPGSGSNRGCRGPGGRRPARSGIPGDAGVLLGREVWHQ